MSKLSAALSRGLVVIGSWGGAAKGGTASLSKGGHEFSLQGYARQPSPKFAFGMLASRSSGRPGGDYVSRSDRNGTALGDVAIVLPGVTRTLPNDPAVSPAGGVCVTATLVSADNRTTSAIIWIGKAGEIERVVETSPFAAKALVFADDGTLRAMGRECEADRRDKADYGVLRHYDSVGRMIGSVLPKSTFPEREPHLVSTLAAGQGRVGVLTPSEWIELSQAGEVLGRWRMPALAKRDKVTGVAIGSLGHPWMSIQSDVGPGRAEGSARSGIPVRTGQRNSARVR